MEASGVDEEIGRNTLKGLEGVWVYVFDLDENEKRVGFSKTALLAEVELRLRMAGIKVLTRKEMAKTPGLLASESAWKSVTSQAIETHSE